MEKDSIIVFNVIMRNIICYLLTILNLVTTTDYNLNGYCLSQIGSRSDLKSRSFTTDSNGGYITKLDFFF